jgi:Collagen triple helix repeat (20 copies)
MLKSIGLIAVGVALLAATTAGAAALIDGGDIRDNSVSGRDIRDGSLRMRDLTDGAKERLMGQDGADGATGAQGPAGPAGPGGPQGPKGDTGAIGPAGAVGPQGPKGDTGETGPAGPQGERGPAGPVLPTLGHLLYVDDGTQDIAHLSYTLDTPVALNALNELTFFQESVHATGDTFGANVILGVDSDGDGAYEADDLGWHLPPIHVPAELGDDTFVSMDGAPIGQAKVDAPAVPQWWTPNAAKNGLADPTDSDCYSALQNMVANCGDKAFEPTDQVHVIRLVLGGSGSWTDVALRLTSGIKGELETGLR